MKRPGPELKMPDLGKAKVPGVLADLYYDLRDRRLLPLVILILVGIVAAPILLGADPPKQEPPPAIGGTLDDAAPSRLTVTEAQPGLRDYRKRLDGNTPTDPFKQRFTGPPAGSDTSETTASTPAPSGDSGSGAISVPPPSSVPVESFPAPDPLPPSGGSPGRGGEDANDDGIPDGSTLFTYVLDLQITRIETKPDGSLKKIGPKLRKNVESPTPLPGEKAPVVTYLGLGAKEPRRPLFLISPDVTAVYGEAECVAGTDTCQLIALEPKFPVTFVYGENNVRYKINLIDIAPKPVDPPE